MDVGEREKFIECVCESVCVCERERERERERDIMNIIFNLSICAFYGRVIEEWFRLVGD